MRKEGISCFALHVFAMACMTCDHAWALLFPQCEWLTWIGRIAFPVFAFLIVQGYKHTSDLKRYMKRMLVFALVSEIPFNLMYGSSVFYPFHQNVLWTFLIALCAMTCMDRIKGKYSRWISGGLCALITLVSFVLGYGMMSDYFGAGVLTVLVFYFLKGNTWIERIGQLICLAWINLELLGGYYVPVEIAGFQVDIIQQGFALVALIPIWLYRGRQGYHAKWFQYFCYAYYPVHMLVLYGIWQLWIR
ncbi:MAG: TraX family protein [Bulleidia sp.]